MENVRKKREGGGVEGCVQGGSEMVDEISVARTDVCDRSS